MAMQSTPAVGGKFARTDMTRPNKRPVFLEDIERRSVLKYSSLLRADGLFCFEHADRLCQIDRLILQ